MGSESVRVPRKGSQVWGARGVYVGRRRIQFLNSLNLRAYEGFRLEIKACRDQ